MKNIIAICIASIDRWLYKHLGIVTKFRKTYWTKKSNEIQHQLDNSHARKDHINRVMGTNYTTKRALIEYKKYYIVED